jgi:hypothetical protein
VLIGDGVKVCEMCWRGVFCGTNPQTEHVP